MIRRIPPQMKVVTFGELDPLEPRRSRSLKTHSGGEKIRGTSAWTRHGDHAREQLNRTCKVMLPYTIFFFYCAFGSLVFHLVEANMEPTHDQRTVNTTKCIGGEDYWRSVFYVVSVCSTIGFGTLYPCTTPTRILSIVYSVVGIPLVLMILADIGHRMCHLIRTIYTPIYFRIAHGCRKQCRRNRRNRDKFRSANSSIDSIDPKLLEQINLNFGDGLLADSASSEEEGDLPDIPVSLGIILTLGCIFLCAVYYYLSELYSPGESVYFAILTFFAGDFATSNFSLTAPVYALIFLGFSMLSATINIIQHNIHNLMHRVKREVKRELVRAVAAQQQQAQDGDSCEETDVPSGTSEEEEQELPPITLRPGSAPASDLARRRRHLSSLSKRPSKTVMVTKNADEIVNEILKKHGATWMSNLIIPRQEMQTLETFAEEVVNMSHVGTQTHADPSAPRKRTTGTQYTPTVSRSTKCETEQIPHTESGIMALPDQEEQMLQTSPEPTFDWFSQTSPRYEKDEQSQTVPSPRPTKHGATVQACPLMEDVEAGMNAEDHLFFQTGTHQATMAKPTTRTIKMQYPRRLTFLELTRTIMPQGQPNSRHSMSSDS